MAALAAVAAVVLRKSNALSRSIQVRLDRINRVVREAVTRRAGDPGLRQRGL